MEACHLTPRYSNFQYSHQLARASDVFVKLKASLRRFDISPLSSLAAGMGRCENNFGLLSTQLSHFFGIANSIICIVSTFGNSLIFFVFYKDRRLHTRSSCCLLSLVTTDFLAGFLLEPIFTTQLFYRTSRTNCGLNTVRRFITSMLLGASMSSIALISYDRYLLLSKSSQYNSHMTKRRIGVLILLCWVLPGLSPLLNYSFAGHGFFSAVIFVYTFLMLFIISWSYYTIIKIVKRNEARLVQVLRNDLANKVTKSQKRNKTDRSRIKAARAISVILLCFIASNAPLTCYLAIATGNTIMGKHLLGPEATDAVYVGTITVTLLNSIINPIIYYFRIPGFKNSLIKLLGLSSGIRVSSESRNYSAS